jgi:hypothetical protein
MAALVTYWGVSDLIAGNGMQRGHYVNEHLTAVATGEYLKAKSQLLEERQ